MILQNLIILSQSNILIRYSLTRFILGLSKKKPLSKTERLKIDMAVTYSPTLLCSTIGHEGLNFSVRYGKR